MKRIIDEPCTHKTYKLLLYAKETSSVLVCRNPGAMNQKARDYGIIGVDCISFCDFARGKIRGVKYCIDELEEFINYLYCFFSSHKSFYFNFCFFKCFIYIEEVFHFDC